MLIILRTGPGEQQAFENERIRNFRDLLFTMYRGQSGDSQSPLHAGVDWGAEIDFATAELRVNEYVANGLRRLQRSDT